MAVVGGGITGALVSHLLVKQGVDTVLVDREEVGLGSTAASTGLLQYEVDTPLVELIQKVGERNAVHAYRRGLSAIDELESLVGELNQACGFARRPALYLASSQEDAVELGREYECRRHFGFDVAHWKSAEIRSMFGFSAPAAIFSRGDGEVDPYRLTQVLLASSRGQGLRAFQNTAVVQTEETATHVTLATPRGKLVARMAIFATGYAAHEFFARGPGKLHTTYATASQVLGDLPQWPDRCLIWETARPYFYARRTADGRVLIGGEDTPFSDDHEQPGLLEAKAQRLARRFEKLFPGTSFEPEYRWAGTFAETKDGLPYIGAPPGHQRVMFALGYGGNGITFSMIAAKLLSDLFRQQPNEDAAVFSFVR